MELNVFRPSNAHLQFAFKLQKYYKSKPNFHDPKTCIGFNHVIHVITNSREFHGPISRYVKYIPQNLVNHLITFEQIVGRNHVKN